MIARQRPSALLALLALLVLSPLLLVVAGIVFFGLGRPILFRQIRSGRDGVPFQMIKFRTMREAFAADGGPMPDAARTTRAGRFLRRSRLDELPELVNIVRGEMAFIGPRPLLPPTVAAMGVDGVVRGGVRPGLTGLAQVSGNTLLETQEKLAFDLLYVRHRTVALDATIMLRTVLMIIAGEKRTRRNVTHAGHIDWGG